jgi:P-type conjugative transfer protein TrbL
MDAGIFDTIVTTFTAALQSGAQTLTASALPLLLVFATIAFYRDMSALTLQGGAGAGDAIAHALLSVVRIGIFYWLVQNILPVTTAAYQTFLQWGAAPATDGVSTQTFLTPSTIVNAGFTLAKSMATYERNLLGWSAVWSPFTVLSYGLAYWLIVIAFAGIGLHLMMTLIEFYLAVMVSVVLLPWGVLQPTAFFAEFSLGWITGGLVRVLITAALVGLAVPMITNLKLNPSSGGDPTLYSAVLLSLASGVLAIISWVVPARAAAIAGRGVSLALHGGTLVAGAASAGRFALAVQGATRGVSSMLRRR